MGRDAGSAKAKAKGAALVAAGVGLVAVNAALAWKLVRLDAHVRRTDAGLARIYTVRDEAGNRMRVLNVGGAYQSATYLGDRWHEPPLEYFRALDHMFEAEGVSCTESAEGASLAEGVVRDVLMIGGGGCAWPKHALMTRPNLCIDVVEPDPAVVDIARRFFFVDKLERTLRKREGAAGAARFNMIVDDGLGYLAGCEKRYDAIVNDAFTGKAAATDLAGAAGIRAVKDHLNANGLYLVNVVSGSQWREFRHLIRLINALDEQFAHVTVVFASDDAFGGKDNYLVIATDGDYAFSDVIPFDEGETGAEALI